MELTNEELEAIGTVDSSEHGDTDTVEVHYGDR